MPNPNPSYNHLPKPQGGWNHFPTKPVRIPEVFEGDALNYVRSLDGQCSPMDSIIAVLDKLSPEELEQIKLAIDCLSGSAENKSNTQIQTATATPVSLPDPRLSDKQIASYKSRFGFVPSKFQLNIIDWILNKKGNACCNAVAGSGKTSTLKLVATALWQIGFSPNEIKICVFGKKNSVDLIEKFGKVWQSSISTLHSAGFALIRKELGVTHSEEIVINKYKYKRIAQDFNLISKPGLKKGRLREENIIGDDDDFLELIDLVRTSNQQPTVKVIQNIAYQYEIDNIHQPELLAQWVAYCLKIGEQMAIQHKKLDYTDQIWLAVKWKLHERSWFKPYKYLLLDECQDLNPLQLQLVLVLAEIIFAVGDPRQSIMAFAGADNESYNNIVRLRRATELPLSICYRCPRSHLDLVKQIFPDIPIEPAANAIDGVIHQIESKDIEKFVKNGDVVISRKTAPLVSLCIRLISQGVKATVLGRDIGEFLKKEIDQIALIPGFSFKFFNDAIAQYREIKSQQYLHLDNEEELRQRLTDKLEAIVTIYQSQPQATNIDDLKIYIDKLFSDENSPVTLSTVHKFKGGEAKRIFIHRANDMPMTWRNQQYWQYQQEQNILYVALTRSQEELFIVGEPEWYKLSEDLESEYVEF